LSQKTALLEAQLNSSIDGILVVDSRGKKILQNQRTVELWKIPKEIADNPDDQMQVDHVMGLTRDPDQFVSQIKHLYSHPHDTCRDEIELKDGRVLDRYSAPITGSDGRDYGRIWSFRDITERKRAEEALRRSEENFRRSLDDSPLGVRIVTQEGETVYVNRAMLDIYGYDGMEELNTTPVKKRYTPESFTEFQIRREKRKRGDDVPYAYEVSIVRKDGEVRRLHIHRRAILWDRKEQFEVVYQDITERSRMEETLRESEQRFRELFDNISNGVAIYEVRDNGNDFVFKDFNKAGERLDGDRKEDVIGKSVRQARPGIEAFGLLNVFKRVWKTGIPEHYPVSFYEDERLKKWFENYVYKLPVGDIVAVYDDVTDRKRAEEALRNSQEQMRAFAGRLQAVREEQRTSIAREIHDELGGALTGLRIDFSFLERAASTIENEVVRTSFLIEIGSMVKAIDKTIQAVRKIAMELRPGVLDDLGLVAALEWQLKDFENRSGIPCEFIPPVEDIILDADVSTALFRIVQEALTNVVRHSGATEVRVRLSGDADSATLEVEDNGKGIEKEKLLGKASLGLLGMRERVQIFGGHISVTGTSGKGTKLTVEIPPVEKRKMDRNREGDAG
jgi:PAS domain S-box-containing protein